ncbi:hypothetical protein GA0061078_1196 [Bifidobacterium bohemicum]|uniref:Uncharacterized protein n=1 Tax=Bifidobacterium bohemicum DSM 22767 TaxID=1437606 RepID=A0A086ZGB0_9BIFI|nr:hypothetical protein BBOH_1028 [Bifidobacterium bohemicum DSM 22767]SCC01868.1 hypothetical protein GA0061078_1196 [Bifidobacterium bohemicum]
MGLRVDRARLTARSRHDKQSPAAAMNNQRSAAFEQDTDDTPDTPPPRSAMYVWFITTMSKPFKHRLKASPEAA